MTISPYALPDMQTPRSLVAPIDDSIMDLMRECVSSAGVHNTLIALRMAYKFARRYDRHITAYVRTYQGFVNYFQDDRDTLSVPLCDRLRMVIDPINGCEPIAPSDLFWAFIVAVATDPVCRNESLNDADTYEQLQQDLATLRCNVAQHN